MTNEDLIRMAREARLAEHTHPYQLWSASDDGLERFAALVAAAEREACAVIAFNAKTYIEAAEAIRARGQE